MQAELRAELARRGPQSGPELCRALQISQPTLSRAIRAAGVDVVVVGRARATRYGWRRPLDGVEAPVPVYEVGPPGSRPRLVARLHPVLPRGFLVASEDRDVPGGWAEDLPWWLQDLRPSGYLGRLVARRHPDLAAPADPRFWNDGTVVRYLVRHGWDGVGAFVLGDEAYASWMRNVAAPAGSIPREQRAQRYVELVADELHQATPGSSAAGEHPKLLAVRDDGGRLVPVLVKFSPPSGSPADVRRADLLVAEHHALRTIAAHGHRAASSELLSAGGRMFLEVERFDRDGLAHRIGQVTLATLDAEHLGGSPTWGDAVGGLLAAGIVGESDAREVRWLEAFGRWIGNTDMHLANLSFRLRGARLDGLAPAYDVVPALYSPVAGELVDRAFVPVRPSPADDPSAWEAAVSFWGALAADPRASVAFRGIAETNARLVAGLRGDFELMPLRSPLSPR
jgi:hypothetical protein